MSTFIHVFSYSTMPFENTYSILVYQKSLLMVLKVKYPKIFFKKIDENTIKSTLHSS